MLTEHLAAVPQIQLLGAEEASALRTVSACERDVADTMDSAANTDRFQSVDGCDSGRGDSGCSLFSAVRSACRRSDHRGLVAFYAYGTRVFDPVSSAMELYSRLQSVGRKYSAGARTSRP